MSDDRPTFTLRALPDTVELTVYGTPPLRILHMRPALARSLAANLELFAERAEILEHDETADVPREGSIYA